VFSVWGPPDANPWLSTLLEALGAQLGAPVPPPGMPGPFALAEDGALARVLADAGFVDVTVREVAAPMTVGSFDEWWTIVPSLAGPVAALLASLPDDATASIRGNAETALQPYAGADGYTIPGMSLIAVGHQSGISTP
jgi:hypothetical protein